MLKHFIEKLIHGESLTREEARTVILLMLEENGASEQIAALLTLLRAKGETPEEILGAIDALQENMLFVPTKLKTLDIVGTGGDGFNTVNISTGAAILAAACGVTVAKHGNRAVSSACGAADVLQALGIDIEMSSEKIALCLQTLKIGFCFAPKFNPTLGKIRDVRRRLGIATIFNLVGPFLNPANAKHFVLGVYSEKLLQPFADTLMKLGIEKSVIVHSDGLDEISCSGVTQVIEVYKDQQKKYEIHSEQFGLNVYQRSDLIGGDATTNALLITQALEGVTGAIADALILNAGMAIYIYGLEDNLTDAVNKAKDVLSKGTAINLLNRWQEFSAK